MRIVMVGTGYVGLVSGACFAELGWHVTCIDNNEQKITALQQGIMPIYEPGLAELVAANVTAGRLFFSTDLTHAARNADIIFLAVGTPMNATSGNADLSIMMNALSDITHALSKDTALVIKSTVPVGSCAKIAAHVAASRPELSCAIVSNPEFLREGSAIADFMHPDRIVIGTSCDKAAAMMKRLYAQLEHTNSQLLFTGIETAELIKYASNGFLATKIAFINEMADICEVVGADINDVAAGMGMDSRIGSKFLQAGPGFGGSCFPKDTNALARIAADAGTESRITEAVIASNEARKERMAEKILAACGGSVAGKRIALLGVTFKAGTDDMRDSPSLVIIPQLLGYGATLAVYDPAGMDNAKALLPGSAIHWCPSASAALQQADAAVILTEWEEFATLDLAAMVQQLRSPVLVDLRNIISRKNAEHHGLHYTSLGAQAAPFPGTPINSLKSA
jgi:UDPglucose 6-dehydrogenase